MSLVAAARLMSAPNIMTGPARRNSSGAVYALNCQGVGEFRSGDVLVLDLPTPTAPVFMDECVCVASMTAKAGQSHYKRPFTGVGNANKEAALVGANPAYGGLRELPTSRKAECISATEKSLRSHYSSLPSIFRPVPSK